MNENKNEKIESKKILTKCFFKKPDLFELKD